MLHFGVNTEALTDEILVQATCTQCSQKSTTEVTLYGKNFFVLIFPVFPLGKFAKSECLHCGLVQHESAFDHELQAIAEDLKRETKYPIWFYFFWVIAGAVLVYNIWKKGV